MKKNNLNKYLNKIICTEALEGLKNLPDKCVDCIITSPSYYALRDYGHDQQIGLENTPEAYIEKLCNVFDEAWRVLKDEGTCFVVLGDTYLGSGKGVWKGRTKANKESFQFQQKPKEKLGGWRKAKQLAMIPSRFA